MESTFSTIQNMQIFLRTAFGDSTSAYGGQSSEGPAFQGICQGNGAGPSLWLATSIPLIQMVHQHGHVSTFSGPISGCSTLLTGMIYVDNCNLLVFLPSTTSLETVIVALQQNVLLWQGCLHATGSSLSLKKCSWGLLSFQHRSHHWLPHNDISAPQAIYILDKSGMPTPIHHIRPQDGLEIVGITQSLLGDSTPVLNALQKKANTWQDILKSNFLPQSLLW